jgi:soluble lytic murein transglycosylase-like protein
MQIHLGAANEVLGQPVTEQQLYDPALNVIAGTRYLGKMFGRFKNARTALGAYNQGPRWIPTRGLSNPAQMYADEILGCAKGLGYQP